MPGIRITNWKKLVEDLICKVTDNFIIQLSFSLCKVNEAEKSKLRLAEYFLVLCLFFYQAE
jgi:hypothetical protein